MKIIFGLFIILSFVSCLNASSDETLLGEDKDKNGVRDDVDRFIEGHFKGKNNQNAAKQLAKYQIESIKFRYSKELLEKNSDHITRAYECYRNLNPKKRRAFKDLQSIGSQVFNNKKRILASREADQTLGGSVMRVDDYGLEACEFKIIKE